ncbi:MAG: hypothetical protein KIT84_41360 [Labilithrix sp.]|nr:hypothetical protein [Labilithrix sp.]MCW5817520.1 hypothetical protein [Labilithrix sp.]
MPFAPRLAAGVLAASALLGSSGVASADVQACLNASEKGQKLRAAGKLREARESFVVCGAEGCPAMVRHDCTQWNQDLASVLPTVVFGAKDKSGRDLFDVTVSMDGEKLVSKLDGKSVIVDPGKHTFKFESGGLSATETALVKEGEKSRVITVTLDTGDSAGGATAAGGLGAGGTAPPGADGGGHSIVPWVVVGVGGAALVAGIVIFATTPDRPSNCREDTKRCERRPGQDDASLAADKEQAGTADSQPVLGAIVGAAGLALVAGGLVWHFLEPVGGKSAGLRVLPWTTGKSSGLSLGATF